MRFQESVQHLFVEMSTVFSLENKLHMTISWVKMVLLNEKSASVCKSGFITFRITGK